MAGEKMLHGLGDGELHIHAAAEGQHHDEERKPATGIVHCDGAVGAPVNLRAFAGSKMQLEINRPLRRPDATDVIPQDRHGALIALLAQPLKDLLSAVGVAVEQSRDARLERIKDAAARPSAPRFEARTLQPCRHRLRMEAQHSGGLRDRQALAIVTVVDFGEGLVIDHDWLRSWSAVRAADVARMSLPSRSKRAAVRAMSSCNGPTKWAIKPIRTAGCADKSSCNGEPAISPVLPTGPMGCAVKTSCNAGSTSPPLRQYPGWRDRHARTRATCTGPRK